MKEIHVPKKFLERTGREEGLKNPADVYDVSAAESIAAEVEAEIRRTQLNIAVQAEAEISLETAQLISAVQGFCERASHDFREEFLRLLAEYQAGKSSVSEKIVGYLKEKKFELPRFAIADGTFAHTILAECGLSNVVISRGYLLLLFNLPKPLSFYWWKGDDISQGAEYPSVEWGYFYRALMPVIWEAVGKEESEGKCTFTRLNEAGHHDPEKFYYIWEVRLWEPSERRYIEPVDIPVS